ncbi:hypothetical protein GGR53DRAFT_502747 [Hypoxylon sp. FL1150]|nr:hypothetical protein GGR53DRAFT_502747 [Hypoxylon sp. FL1150]
MVFDMASICGFSALFLLMLPILPCSCTLFAHEALLSEPHFERPSPTFPHHRNRGKWTEQYARLPIYIILVVGSDAIVVR